MRPDPDAELRRTLARYKGFATGLLVLMGGLVGVSYALPSGLGADLLQASAKAGFVGGIADWFAVTALFRHPLGLPIPHTAIIPRQKARLGRALGRFVAGHVITPAEVSRVLGRLDFAAILARFLQDPATARPAAQALAEMLPRVLATVEDGRARRTISRLVPRILGGPGAGRVVARALRGLVEGGRHQEVLGFLLNEIRVLLESKHDQLHTFIEEKVRAQGGRLIGWMLGAQVAERVVRTLREELERVGPEGSSIRAAFDEWVRREIDRMENDPERAAEMGRAIRRVVAHETIQAWLWDVWSRLRVALEADAAKPGGRTMALLETTVGNIGALLEEDPAARARVQRAAEGVIASFLPSAQAQLADFIGDVVASWDAATISDKLELRVGRDLQFVRVNGTLVGFLAGGVLYLLLWAVAGRVVSF
ncbi:MAG: DUF445 domain-containing protein [Acetobacteraceae bacterium]|nr:DUF445 domain-containing protein [Acetobacteraceae bacterium]